jgi:hypothetical protein
MPSKFELFYGKVEVGGISSAFCSDDTWHGNFRTAITSEQGPLQRRLCDFIGFCEEWNARCDRGENPDPADFDRYSDVLTSGLWCTSAEDGVVAKIDAAPVFFPGGDVSWRGAG